MTMSVMIGGHFSLLDHNGRRVDESTFRGQYVLLFFGFTHCRVVCPRALDRISRALELIGDRANRVQPLYVTVDPERDTAEVMKAFLEKTHPRFLGLTGTRGEIDAMKAAFKVFAARKEDAQEADGYVVPHTAFTFLLDAQGHYLAHFIDAGDAEELAQRLLAHIGTGGA
jgi:protein SCO1